ncbi:MAG: IS3 family transposase [Oligoflexia bacterium]|nr:IS3 family transposase [Oligoflexia bacterium]
MRGKRYSDETIIKILKEHESGIKSKDICRTHGISASTLWEWKNKYQGMEKSDLQRLKLLEDENRKLKKLVADLSLDNMILKDVKLKKVVGTQAKRDAAEYSIKDHQISQRHACALFTLSRSTYKYKPKQSDRNEFLKIKLKSLALQRRRFGSPRLYVMLRREGVIVNHKRVERIYQQEGLQIKKRKKKRQTAPLRIVTPLPERPNERWSMDFVSDQLSNGKRFRTLNVVDDYTRECLAIEVNASLPGYKVIQVLEKVIDERERPKIIVCDNGPEFSGALLDEWSFKNNIKLDFISPGRPVENCFIESFNGRFRDECLNENWFINLEKAKEIIELWREDYNTARPHSSLNNLTPSEFVEQHRLKHKT